MFQIFNRSLVSHLSLQTGHRQWQWLACSQPWSLLWVHNLLHSERVQHLRGKVFDILANVYHIKSHMDNLEASFVKLSGWRLFLQYWGRKVLCAPFVFVFLSTGVRIGIPFTKPESWVDTGPRLWSSGEWDYREAGFQKLDRVSRGWSAR